MAAAPDVVVVGAGVAGLTTAVCLAEAGARVVIAAERMPEATTSAVAGAIWGLHSAEASERAAGWAGQTLAELRRLAGEAAAGVRIATGMMAVRTAPAAGAAARPPEGLAGLPGVEPCDPVTLPAGFASGWRYAAPLVHMPSYLTYLRARFERAGGLVRAGRVRSLTGAARDHGAGTVVNCTGAQARHLVPDPAVVPARGQTVVAANPGISDFFIGLADRAHEVTYLFPHGDTVVLGGTETAGDWNTEPDPRAAARILRNCATIDPRLRGGRVLHHRVGLRPLRPVVRLEAETRAVGPAGDPAPLLVVHNYGHGGAGVTLSWGCARAAAALVTGARAGRA